jgi:cytochrome c oxidase subunit 3
MQEIRHDPINDFRSLPTHPYSIMMYLLLAGLTMVFVGLSFSYLYTRVTMNVEPIKIPLIFLLNTAVLAGSSWMLRKAKVFYTNDNTEGYQRALWGTLILTLVFTYLQFLGWQMLWEENPQLVSERERYGNMRDYVWAISIIHLLHILGGLPFFIIFLYTAYVRMKEPVSVLVYFSDPVKQLRLRLLTLYWQFLDILWLYLMVFFWGNYFIQFK